MAEVFSAVAAAIGLVDVAGRSSYKLHLWSATGDMPLRLP
jgi:hypothetical protein